ncbi:vesicle-fusing ATPase 1-like [Paramacrobiotus metropolitanus]|uniref:vesicle-fusing ATPase 1-like n=1 Tax=Paramacrobiotus metropolitanus TaxID=2943436 RepID=UPI002445D8A9|nr:vesicle-fusing ATPase 1-like [Paramacrobiotus metropolitanus]XP_055343676.1 vesicle-fusing ATPase 1-like [Paramacrobiotus metropolitanus]
MAQMRNFLASKSPSQDLVYTNCAIVNAADWDSRVQHILLQANGKDFIFTIRPDAAVKPGEIGFGDPQRKWALISIGQHVHARAFAFYPEQYLASVTLEIDFYSKAKVTQDPLDTDKMAMDFQQQFPSLAVTKGQLLVFSHGGKPPLRLLVKSLGVIDLNAVTGNDKQKAKSSEPADGIGVTTPNIQVNFEKAEGAVITLTGKSLARVQRTNILNPDWNFEKMGIGGLDKEFSTIFRRAFASRVVPPDLIEKLGIKHCRGMLLYGPPGTGKTLIARQIGKMLNAREPQIVSGPSILDKYVGESEANIRKLFAAAEEEEKRMGPHSQLHIIIFDEIDAICKARGSVAGNTAVHDTIVNQLLAKMDGVDQLNNILVIGMTNRKDMIDEALIRPGRMEIQMEISLPDEYGRVQILNIHTARMREQNNLGPDVDIKELAEKTKNFSGAELEGLVRAAQSVAMNRLVKVGQKALVDEDALDKFKVNRNDFLHALEHDIKPAFGLNEEVLDRYIKNGIIVYDDSVTAVLELGNLYIQTVKASSREGLISLLLEGAPSSGKSCLAAKICKDSQFPFMKVCTPRDMIGFTETAKCMAIKKVFDDAYKSELSCVLVDDIEGLIDYAPIGPRFSNLVLQALLVLMNDPPPKNHKLLVLGTTACRGVLEELRLAPIFTRTVHVSNISTGDQIVKVLENLDIFAADDLKYIGKQLKNQRLWIGIKKLLAMCSAMMQVEREERVVRFLSELEAEGVSRGQ